MVNSLQAKERYMSYEQHKAVVILLKLEKSFTEFVCKHGGLKKLPANTELETRKPSGATDANSFDRSVKLYEIFREYVKHEDTLANYRAVWFLTSQPFFMTAATAP